MKNPAQLSADMTRLYDNMMLGVKNAETLSDAEKQHIIDMLQDQLRLENQCILLVSSARE